MKKNLPDFSTWDELTRNPQNGLLSFKRLATLVCAVIGVWLVVFAAWADWQAHRPISLEGAVILLSYALGTSIQKGVEAFQARKTVDEDGALATPDSTGAQAPEKPVLMPQSPPSSDTAEAPLPTS